MTCRADHFISYDIISYHRAGVRQKDRQTDKQTGRQADRQTDRRTPSDRVERGRRIEVESRETFYVNRARADDGFDLTGLDCKAHLY